MTSAVADFCPLGCYWECEHRSWLTPEAWEDVKHHDGEITMEQRRAADLRIIKPYLVRYAQPWSPPAGRSVPLRTGTRGVG